MTRKSSTAKESQATPLGDRLPHRPGQPPPTWMAPIRAVETRTLPLPKVDHPLPSSLGPQSLFQQSITIARHEAELEGLSVAQQKVETIIERYIDALQRAQELSRLAARPTASEVTSLALLIARQLVNRELTIDKEIVVEAVDSALAGVSQENDVTIRLSPVDAKYIEQRRPEIGASGTRIVADAAFSLGSFVIETPGRVIDGCLDKRLEAIGRALEAVLAPADPEAA